MAVAASVLLVAWLTLHWAILPHIQQWRGSVETRATRAIGVPVRIADIRVRSRGWVPSVELRDVTLQGPDGQPALRLPRVFASLSPRSLLAFDVVFEQLSVEGAELDVQRDAAGRLFVAGLPLDGTGRDDGGQGAVDWFFRQHEFSIRGGSVRWTDLQRGAPPLVLSNVDFVARNTLRRHALRLDATPPAAWGERFTLAGRFTQPFLARPGDWRRWNGSVHAELPGVDVREARRYAELPFELDNGRGALRSWVDVEAGEPTAATLDLALREVRLRVDPASERLDFAEVEGRLTGTRGSDGAFTLAAERFGFVAGDGLRWPRSAWQFAWRQRPGEASTGGSFGADRLDLALLAEVATRLPLGAPVRQLLGQLKPEGIASRLAARWDGPLESPRSYRVSGTLAQLALASLASTERNDPGRPGVRRAGVEFEATEAGGSARVDITAGTVDLPGVFDDPLLPVDRFGARLLWTVDAAGGAPPKIAVQVQDARFANADVRADFSARWTTGPAGSRFPGRLELDGQLADALAARVPRYLPLGLSRSVRDYFQRAIQGGRIGAASVHVRGDVRDFPFFDAPRAGADAKVRHGPGEFRVVARIDDATFAYVPDTPGSAPGTVPYWPKATRIAADLVVDRNTLEFRNGKARLGDADVDRIGGRIEHLDREPVLSLDASSRAPLADLLQFVNVSPIGGWTGQALAGAAVAGNAELKVALGVPLGHPETGSSVRGNLTLAGNDVRPTPAGPLLGNARGRVDFTEQGFAVVGASAKVYGGDAAFQGGTQADGTIRFAGQGSATADGLRRADELGPVARLAHRFAGQTAYRAELAFVRGAAELHIASNLVGLAIDLPAPFAKTAETSLSMRYQTTGEPQPPGALPRETLQFDLGTLLQARFLRELGADAPRVVRGGIGVMAEAPTPASGVSATVDTRSLDLDAWQRVEAEVFPAAVVAAGRPASAAEPATGAAATGATANGGYEPDHVALRVQEFSAGSRRLTGLTADLSREGETWRANLDADQLAGHVEYRPAGGRDGAGAGRVFARLSRLALPKSEADPVSGLLDAPPASVPALDVVIDDLDLRGTRLGRVEIVATNRAGGPRRTGERDWQLTRLAIRTPEAELTGTGRWAASPVAAPGSATAPRRMSIDFGLQIADGGALLDRLGTEGAVRGGAGRLSGRVSWLGSPLALDNASLAGQVRVEIDAGQFLKVDPGAARLLGVLNLQSLPRRLALDFRDVFAEGFAFDNVTGDVRIAQGVAETNNLRMRGVQATVLMEGSADIGRETQNLRVVVVPEINAGTAALAYAAINPAIGIGAFVAQWILRKPLMAASTREFHVSGPWDDPKIEPVARGEAPVPPASAPAVGR